VTVQRKGGERKTIKVQLAGTTDETEVASKSDDSRNKTTTGSTESRLGVALEPISERQAAQDENIGADHAGLMVTSVDPDGPADGRLFPAHSAQGTDIITHVNGQRVKSAVELATVLKTVKAGEVVSLQTYVVRGDGTGTSRIVRLRAAAPK